MLAKNIGVKEAVTRALFSMTTLEQMEEHPMESHVGKLAKAIQKLQQRVAEL
jgi:hypothetical protein